MPGDCDAAAEITARAAPRLLIVDDDVTLLLLMSRTLKGAGFVVAQATNGSEAVAQYREFRPDLILLDIEMPEMDGFSACSEIRKDASAHSLPIVMVTGLDDAASIHRAFEAGATDFILKPINWPLFLYRVTAVLQAARISVELVSSTEKVDSLERITPDIALVVAHNGDIVEWLGSGHSARVRQGRAETLEDIWPREIASTMRRRIKRVLKTREGTSYEFELSGEQRSRFYEARFLVDGRKRVLVVVQEVVSRTSGTEMYQLAYYDSSTHLPNRHLLEKHAAERLADAKLREHRLGVLRLEFEKLDQVLDRLGRPGAEEAVVALARCLVQAVGNRADVSAAAGEPDAATVARLSAGQFAVLLPRIHSREGVASIAGRIRDAFDGRTVTEDHQIHLKPIIGISMFPDDGQDVRTLMEAAEAAMQEARVAEDAGACFYSEMARLRSADRYDLATELRWAIEQDQLQLHYQPRVNIDSDQVVGFEALLRWHHPLRGYVPLNELLPLAEATGLIKRIGEWVLMTACRDASTWNEWTEAPIRVSINLSHQEFFRPELSQQIGDVLRQTGLEPAHLGLEITERTLMRAQDPVGSLRQLRALGVGFMLDDFGTGFSSLAYLKQFPVDALKIDGAFVRGVPDARADAAICEVIIGTAHKLGLKAVAEEVETPEQAEFLHRHGCDEMQGFLVAQPMPLAEVQAFLSREAYPGKRA